MSGNGIGALCEEKKCQRRNEIDAYISPVKEIDAYISPVKGYWQPISFLLTLGKDMFNMASCHWFSEKLDMVG